MMDDGWRWYFVRGQFVGVCIDVVRAEMHRYEHGPKRICAHAGCHVEPLGQDVFDGTHEWTVGEPIFLSHIYMAMWAYDVGPKRIAALSESTVQGIADECLRNALRRVLATWRGRHLRKRVEHFSLGEYDGYIDLDEDGRFVPHQKP